MMDPIEAIDLKFKSGNDVPVQDARITREEWGDVKRIINHYSNGDAGEMVGRWIKCSERMPDAGVPVLGFGHANESTTVYRTVLRWYEYVDDEWIEGVTHWMPLPKPPETGEKCKCCGGTKVFPADHNFACPECDNN